MKHPATNELYAYWSRLRGREPAPRRSAIEPSDISNLLGDTFILEVEDAMRFPFRLAGTRLCSAFGRELKGRNFLSLWGGEDIQAIATLLAAVATDAAAAVLGVESWNDRGGSTPSEMLLLPLTQDGRTFDRILGLVVPMDRPYWLGVHPVVLQSIASLRLIWPDDRAYFMREDYVPPSPPASIPMAMPSAALQAGRRHQHLVVLDGGKP